MSALVIPHLLRTSDVFLLRRMHHANQKLIKRKLHRYKTVMCNKRQVLKGGSVQHVEQQQLESLFPAMPELDWHYITDPANKEEIQANIHNRKGRGNIEKVHLLWEKYKETSQSSKFERDSIADSEHTNTIELEEIKQKLIQEALLIPNLTYPRTPIGDESQAKLVETIGKKTDFNFPLRDVTKIGKKLDALRLQKVGHTTGEKSYYFKGWFVQLQDAIIKYTLDILLQKGFEMVYIPDMIHPDLVESCGFRSRGVRTQVYHLEESLHGSVCLAGTGELPLAGMCSNTVIPAEQLPKKYLAVSRCYRAEAPHSENEKGIYRVHQFTKVEMFGLTSSDTGQESNQLTQQFLSIQREIFSNLGLHFRILEMPSEELGSPAYRKYDMETWLPWKGFWGEISSTSNCTDFQSRRLNIKYRSDSENTTRFVHTVNGTACAIPRLIMAIAENYQTENGEVVIPEVLRPYMDNHTVMTKKKGKETMWWIRRINL